MDNVNLLQNDTGTVRFRRYSNTLVVLGTGVILYGFWSVIKLVAYLLLGYQIYDPSQMEGMTESDTAILMIVLAVVMTGDVIVRLIIGLNAISEGRGKKVRRAYLVFNIWEILFGIFSVGSLIYMITIAQDYGDFEDNYIAFFMELTSLAILIEVYIAALIVRKYKSKHIEGRM